MPTLPTLLVLAVLVGGLLVAGTGNAAASPPKYEWTIFTDQIPGEWSVSTGNYAPDPVYDPNSGHVIAVAFGGFGFAQEATYALEGRNWVRLPGYTPQGIGLNPMLVYDARDGYVLLIDSEDDACFAPHFPTVQMWKFVDDGWRYLPTRGAPIMQASCGSSSLNALYDTADGYVILFGPLGNSSNPYHLTDQMWTFTGGVWSRLHISLPRVRYGDSMSYDAGTGMVLLAWNGWWGYHAGVWQELQGVNLYWGGVSMLTYDPFLHGMVAEGGFNVASPTWIWPDGAAGFHDLGSGAVVNPRATCASYASSEIFWPYDPSNHSILCFGSVSDYFATLAFS
jgi:hypothetical protein